MPRVCVFILDTVGDLFFPGGYMALLTRLFKALLMLALVAGVVTGGVYVGLVASADSHGSAAADPTTVPTDQTPATPREESTSSPKPSATDRPDPTPQLAAGARGVDVRDLQARLFQLAWLPEQTTGRYDAATVAAVRGFQAKRGLPTTGQVDERTWKRLASMTKPPTHDQLFNVLHPGPPILQRGDSGDEVRALQARLKEIAWYAGDVTGTYDSATVTAVRGFQAKREIPVTGATDQRTLDRLAAMTSTPTHEAMYNIEPKPGALDARCRTGRVLCIDKTSQTLRWVVDGKVLQTLDVRFGASYSPTREGVFSVYSKDADHVSRLYGSAMPYSMFFSGGQAVHYSSDFAARGYAGASHGCVNVRDYSGIQWLFSQVQIGDRVVIYWS